MPFDNAPVIDTALERRRRLIAALRSLPVNYEWNFAVVHHTVPHHKNGGCGSAGCACGLAYELGIANSKYPSAVGHAIGLRSWRATQIFAPIRTKHHYGVRSYARITPTMVADKLEREPIEHA